MRLLLFFVAFGGITGLFAQTLTSGSVGSIDAGGNVTFSLTFDRVPDFTTTDSSNRMAMNFQFYIVAGPEPRTIRPLLSLIRGPETPGGTDIVIRSDSPADPNAGGWGPVRGRVSYAIYGQTIVFSAPAAMLNVSGPFVYTVELYAYGGTTSTYTGISGGPIQFTAPATLARSAFRDYFSYLQPGFRSIPGYQGLSESTIIFEDETHFTFLVYRDGRNPPDTDGKTSIVAPKPNGAYKYERSTNGHALLSLTFDDQTKTRLTLDFTSRTSGTVGNPDGTNIIELKHTFLLSDLTSWDVSVARNVSMRGSVASGRPLIVGFIVPVPREVLIRVVGPSLRSFGIQAGWAKPDFQLYNGNTAYETLERHSVGSNGSHNGPNASDDSAGLSKVYSYVGAFPLQTEAGDTVNVVRLEPGSYTVVCSPNSADVGGDALVEVYFLP